MKLSLLFLVMDLLTLLFYPVLYVYGKIHQWTILITHLTQNVPKVLLRNLVELVKPSGRCVTSLTKLVCYNQTILHRDKSYASA